MRRLFFVAIFMFIPSLAHAQMGPQTLPFDERWMLCRTDVECVIVAGVCGEEMVVNRMSVQQYMEYKQSFLNLGVSCAPNIPHYNVRPHCVEGECAYDLPFDVP